MSQTNKSESEDQQLGNINIKQLAELRAIVSKNGVDAWDLGFQGQYNPGEIDRAIKTFITRFGYKQAKELLTNLKKR